MSAAYRIELFRGKDRQHYWRIVHRNRNILATRRAGAQRRRSARPALGRADGGRHRMGEAGVRRARSRRCRQDAPGWHGGDDRRPVAICPPAGSANAHRADSAMSGDDIVIVLLMLVMIGAAVTR